MKNEIKYIRFVCFFISEIICDFLLDICFRGQVHRLETNSQPQIYICRVILYDFDRCIVFCFAFSKDLMISGIDKYLVSLSCNRAIRALHLDQPLENEQY